MKHILFFIMIVTFSACGGGDETTTETAGSQTITSQTTNETTNETTSETGDETAANSLQTLTPTETLSQSKESKTLTLYIHGYAENGYKSPYTYGVDSQEAELSGIIEATGFSTTQNYDKENFTNLFAIASYYGSTPPGYYSQQDVQEVERMQGIPRYARIMAKYAKHIMKESGAERLNIISVSMGSLVSRYLIEKDLEGLSSQKKIQKWLSFEGVIKGNVAASSDNLLDFVETFEAQSPDVKNMTYDWIEANLDESNPYYKNIQSAFESSTKDSANKGLLSFWLHANKNFQANDGIQLVKDTYFNNTYSHTYMHDNHYTLADNKAAWGYAATFLTSSKRVRLTLVDATLSDLHEDKVLFQNILPAEIVFESSVHAPIAQEKWNFSRAIDERLLKGKTLTVYDFKTKDTKKLNLTLFDSYILPQETTLSLTVEPYELDAEPDYGVKEVLTGHGNHESLGETTIMIPTKEGVYPLQGRDWSGHVKVEVY